MKVLHLTTTFPRRAGDAEGVFLLDGTTCLAERGMTVHVLAPHDTGADTDEVVDGVNVRRFRYAPDWWERLAYRGGMLANVRHPTRAVILPVFFVAYLRAALAEARRVQPDVVHAHWWLPSGVVGALVARRLGLPLVVTLHGSDVHVATRWALRPLARWVLRRADVVATVSDALRAEVVANFGLDPAHVPVLPMPVRMEPVRPWSPPATPPLRLVAVGRLVPEKGFDVLIEAVNRLAAKGVDVTVDVVGDGPVHASLLIQAAPLGAAVRFHGALPRHDIAALLAEAHALVVPSRREGLGMVALEALAVGCPVIASATGGLIDVVAGGADGVLVPPGDVDALIEALLRLPLAAPRAAAVPRHMPDTMAVDHRSAYDRAIAIARRG